MSDHISKPKAYSLVALLAFVLVFAATGVSELVSRIKNFDTKNISASIVTADGLIKKADFPNVALSARAAVVFDVNRGEVLFDKNGDAQLPLASLTKIMTALTARDLFPKDATVTINQNFLKEGDGGFRDGQQWKLKDILDATLVKSTNDGASAIAGAYATLQKEGNTNDAPIPENSFLRAMNDKAQALGLTQTYFLNVTGLDEEQSLSGAYGSARDMAKLFSYAVKAFPDAFEATRYDHITVTSVGKTAYNIENTNPDVDKIPGLIASKTGFTDLAGGNLVIVIDVGPMHPIAIAVLGSTKDGRFTDVLALVDATLRYFSGEEGDTGASK